MEDQATPSSMPSRPTARHGAQVLTDEQWRALVEHLRFSEREFDVVRGVFDDLKESAIAARLGISAHTVHTHLERLYRKVGVNGRAQLIIEIFAEVLRSEGRANPAIAASIDKARQLRTV